MTIARCKNVSTPVKPENYDKLETVNLGEFQPSKINASGSFDMSGFIVTLVGLSPSSGFFVHSRRA